MSEQKVTLTEREKAVTNVDEKIIETVDITKLVNAKQPKIWLRLDGEFRPGQRGGRDAANFFLQLRWRAVDADWYKRTTAWCSTIVVSLWVRSSASSTMQPKRPVDTLT